MGNRQYKSHRISNASCLGDELGTLSGKTRIWKSNKKNVNGVILFMAVAIGVGAYKNSRTTWSTEGKPKLIKMHNFNEKELGCANPYGVYDVTCNT